MKTHITLGVDPGIANTGLAIVEANGTRSRGCEISIRCGTCAACLICAGYSTERHRIPHASATIGGLHGTRNAPHADYSMRAFAAPFRPPRTHL